jgi:hypothetical protein
MFKLNKEFEQISNLATTVNSRLNKPRFHTIFHQNKRFVTVGLYDALTKQYELFDSINFAGNYRYDKNVKPVEFFRMESMLKSAR